MGSRDQKLIIMADEPPPIDDVPLQSEEQEDEASKDVEVPLNEDNVEKEEDQPAEGNENRCIVFAKRRDHALYLVFYCYFPCNESSISLFANSF